MEPIVRFDSRYITIPEDNIDTDQIIPARFMVTTTRAGLGENLFFARRYLEGGGPNPAFPLNQPEAAGATVLVAGRNFGCGSSREHAPWALLEFGFRAIVTSSMAEIFRSNCGKNGIVPAVIPSDAHDKLLASKTGAIRIDVEACTVTSDAIGTVPFEIDSFARTCLLRGVDELGFLLGFGDAITAFEKRNQS